MSNQTSDRAVVALLLFQGQPNVETLKEKEKVMLIFAAFTSSTFQFLKKKKYNKM